MSEWTSPCSLQKCRPSSVLIGTGAVASPDALGGPGGREALGVSRSQAIHRGGGHGGVVATAPEVPKALEPTPTRLNDAVVVARCRALELAPWPQPLQPCHMSENVGECRRIFRIIGNSGCFSSKEDSTIPFCHAPETQARSRLYASILTSQACSLANGKYCGIFLSSVKGPSHGTEEFLKVLDLFHLVSCSARSRERRGLSQGTYDCCWPCAKNLQEPRTTAI